MFCIEFCSRVLGQSVPGRYQGGGRKSHARLSSSAPTHLGLEQIWQRREPRQHLLSTGSLAEATSTSSISTGEFYILSYFILKDFLLIVI